MYYHKVIDYIQSKEIEIVTAKEGLKLFGNSFEIYNEHTNEFTVITKFGFHVR